MSNLTVSRRQILKSPGSRRRVFVLEPPRADGLVTVAPRVVRAAVALTPVRLPHPLSIFERMASFLGAAGRLEPTARAGCPVDAYTVIDDVVAPPSTNAMIVHWGDRVFPHVDDYVGYNADYTAFLPIRGRDEEGTRGSTIVC